ncbi:MAG: hypothetical protein HQL32_12425 [Planctomycetes bacterium]|nr:hypothetical protein [Planctomycetota bacterium]
MKAVKLMILLMVFCLGKSTLHAENATQEHISEQLVSLEAKLNKYFFKKLFLDSDLQELYLLALEEEMNVEPLTLISADLRDLAQICYKHSLQTPASVLETWQELESLDLQLLSLKDEEKGPIVVEWRSMFLAAVEKYMLWKKSQKSIFSLALGSSTQYDTNVNRTPDEVSGPDALSGKGGQQVWMMGLKWRPLRNVKKFSRNWELINTFQGVSLQQFAHKEKDLALMDMESKIIRKQKGYLQKTYASYRFRHFFFSPSNNEGRSLNSYFGSHRIKLGVQSSQVKHEKSWLLSSYGDLAIHWLKRNSFQEAVLSQNGAELGLDYTHHFQYDKMGKVSAGLEYATFSADESEFDYNILQPELSHKRRHAVSSWAYPISIKESISYRMKEWDSYTGGELNEDRLELSAEVKTRLVKKLHISVGVKQNYYTTEKTGLIPLDTDADRFRATLGLNWIIK